MKKFLAVLTVLSVSVIGSMAFAQEAVVKGNVEIYGIGHVSYDLIDSGTTGANADESSTAVSSNSSRLGFKGSEDLGNDMNLMYQVEMQTNMDKSGSGVTLRNSFAGLKSNNLGMILLGTHDSPYKVATGRLDVFGDALADYNAIIGCVNGVPAYDNRFSDTLHYNSPTWSGVQVMVARTSAEAASTPAAPLARANALAVNYANGPIYATAAYEKHSGTFNATATANRSNDAMKLGVGYAINDAAKISFIFETISDDASNTAISRDAMYLGLSYKMGNETIKFAYGSADDGDNTATETGATQMSVGVDHSMTKRTTVYALYSTVDNDAQATYGFGQSGHGGAFLPGAGNDPSAFSFGVRHVF